MKVRRREFSLVDPLMSQTKSMLLPALSPSNAVNLVDLSSFGSLASWINPVSFSSLSIVVAELETFLLFSAFLISETSNSFNSGSLSSNDWRGF